MVPNPLRPQRVAKLPLPQRVAKQLRLQRVARKLLLLLPRLHPAKVASSPSLNSN